MHKLISFKCYLSLIWHLYSRNWRQKKKGGKKKIKVFELILLRWKRKNLQENRGAEFSLKCGTSFLS